MRAPNEWEGINIQRAMGERGDLETVPVYRSHTGP